MSKKCSVNAETCPLKLQSDSGFGLYASARSPCFGKWRGALEQVRSHLAARNPAAAYTLLAPMQMARMQQARVVDVMQPVDAPRDLSCGHRSN